MNYSESQVTDLLLRGAEYVLLASDGLEGQLLGNLSAVVDNWNIEIPDRVYIPDDTLKTRLAQYELWCQNQIGEDAGKLMEELALLAFRCLEGWESVKSFQSYAAQHDLVISGSKLSWLFLMMYLRLPPQRRTIVVEAKNLTETEDSAGKISDQQFSRLCIILQNKFDKTSELGVFFSRFGATGFPAADSRGHATSRKRVLRDAQATQVIFHAKTGKYVVVIDHQDIQKLGLSGALPRILEAKIRAVEEWTGLPVDFDEEWREVDLPPHLMKYMQ